MGPAVEAPVFFSREDVEARLTWDGCIGAVRDAMIALSDGRTRQLPRSMIGLGEGRTFALMPGALALGGYFGAKLISVFADPGRPGRTAHEGVVVVFDGASGRPLCMADAGAITQIRTAAASAVATDALARPDARTLTLLGHGHQAIAHIHAIARVRALNQVFVWGRSIERARAFADQAGALVGLPVEAIADARSAVAAADIICTLTPSREPILGGYWVAPGAHVNLVGSSSPASVEADQSLVVLSRYVVESRESAQAAYAEFRLAKAAGAVDDTHIAAEIGEILAGRAPGRTRKDEITVYKSIGHVVQDLAAAAWLYNQTRPLDRGLSPGPVQ